MIYKIRDKKSGLYSSGGTYPRYSNGGKIYNKLSHVKSHLRLHNSITSEDRYLEVVLFDLIENKIIPAHELNEKFISEINILIKDIIT